MQRLFLLWTLFLAQCVQLYADEARDHPATGKIEYRNIDEARFHELEARDWNGKPFSFERLEGYVTIIMNVQWDWRSIREGLMKMEAIHAHYPYVVEFLVFPTNVPCTGDDEETMVEKRLVESKDWKINIMQHVDINGPDTHPVYEYLKELFDIETLNDSYATYFYVSPDGDQASWVDGAHLAKISEGIKQYIEKYL